MEGGEPPSLWTGAVEAVAKIGAALVIAVGSLFGWLYRRQSSQLQEHATQLQRHDERLKEAESHLKDVPTREELDRHFREVRDDIRGVHTRLDQTIQPRGNDK